MNTRKRTRFPVLKAGFTLTEIVIVVLILMIGIIPIYDAMVNSSKKTRFNRRRNFAASICNNAVELFKKIHIKTLVEGAASIEQLAIPQPNGEIQCTDTLLCPWLDDCTHVKEFADANPDFQEMLESYRKEFSKYKVLSKITPATDPVLKDKLCSFQVKVIYKDLNNKEKPLKTVAAGMIYSDPTFPAGKALQQ